MDQPTLAGFIAWARTAIGVPTGALADISPFWGYAYNVSVAIVSLQLSMVDATGLIYMLAVYNLAGDNLINWAPDTAPSTYFTDLRKSFDCNAFTPGVVSEAHDETTGQSMEVITALKDLTLGQLQNLKTPYGRQYLSFAQSLGGIWGLS